MGAHGDNDQDGFAATEGLGGAELTTNAGFPQFEHNQWTIEGGIERLGAFARGSHHVHGWRRAVAVFLALLFVLPLALTLVAYAIVALGRLIGF